MRILRIEKENPLRASETAQRVADSLRAANRAIAVMPPTERAKFEDYSQVMIEARHAAETQALSKAMLALSSPDREAAAAVLEEPPPIDTKPLEWRLAIACWAANELAKHHNHRVSGAATRTRKTRARDELATYLAGTLINHLPPIAGDRNDVRKRAAARKGAAEVLRALGIKFPDQTSNPAKFNRMFRFKEGLS